jgi:hypothetical protein
MNNKREILGSIKFNRDTKDQITKILLIHGNILQKNECLKYIEVKGEIMEIILNKDRTILFIQDLTKIIENDCLESVKIIITENEIKMIPIVAALSFRYGTNE